MVTDGGGEAGGAAAEAPPRQPASAGRQHQERRGSSPIPLPPATGWRMRTGTHLLSVGKGPEPPAAVALDLPSPAVTTVTMVDKEALILMVATRRRRVIDDQPYQVVQISNPWMESRVDPSIHPSLRGISQKNQRRWRSSWVHRRKKKTPSLHQHEEQPQTQHSCTEVPPASSPPNLNLCVLLPWDREGGAYIYHS